jgi:secondary thiamine-phosphate synthase enzyme
MVVTKRLRINTQGDGDIVDVTDLIQQELSQTALNAGMATAFVAHTTAGLAIIETEAGLLEDFKGIWDRIAPRGATYQHNVRANDDNAHSHLRASILGQSLVVPFSETRLLLATWQRIILMDFDSRERHRDVVLQFFGD